LFKEIMQQKKYEYDGVYDWFLDKKERQNAILAETNSGQSARKRREPVQPQPDQPVSNEKGVKKMVF
jgi:hypothetical protein